MLDAPRRVVPISVVLFLILAGSVLTPGIQDQVPPTTEEAKLTALGVVADDLFGFSVAISGDTAVVGAAVPLFGPDRLFEAAGRPLHCGG